MKIMNKDKDFVEYLMKVENKDNLYSDYFRRYKEEHPFREIESLKKKNNEKVEYENQYRFISTENENVETENTTNLPHLTSNEFYSKDKEKDHSNFLLTKNAFNSTNAMNSTQINTSFSARKNVTFKDELPSNLNTQDNFMNKNTKQSFYVKKYIDSSNESPNHTNYTTKNNFFKNRVLKTSSTIERNNHSIEKFYLRMKPNNKNIKVGNLLNVDYNSLFKRKIKIKDKELKTKWDEIDHYGPRFAHCNTCFNKNLDFFENVNRKDGLNIIGYIKEKRIEGNNNTSSLLNLK